MCPCSTRSIFFARARAARRIDVTKRLLRRPGPARFFFAAGQSQIGNGAGYVALLLLAYDAFQSAWAVSAILLADFLPAMLLGPVFGALTDRLPRRNCIIAADLLGCAAFAGLAFSSSFTLVLGLALLAGVGQALATPALMAGISEVVEEEELPAATSIFGVLEEAGVLAGPALGALVLAGGDMSVLLALNAVSFAISALVLTTVTFTPAPRRQPDAAEPSLLASTVSGLRGLREMRGARSLVLTSAVGVLFFGMLNVAELLFAKEELGANDAAFSILVATMSVGMTLGALTGMGSADGNRWRRRYLGGFALMGTAMLVVAGSHELILVAGALLVCGYGNGTAVVHERLLLQHTVEPEMHGRVFGIRRMLVSWAFCGSYLGAGAIAEAIGSRGLIAVAGAGMLLALAMGSRGLRGTWVSRRGMAAAPVPAA